MIKRTAVSVLVFTLCCHLLPPALAEDDASLTADYRSQTKKILLTGIDIERFSLRYRRDSAKQGRFKRLRYFATQETGVSCGLAFEATATNQFNKGRNNLLSLQPDVLRGALVTAIVGSAVAGSGSALELAANGMRAIQNHHKGLDSRSANEYVVSHLKILDGLLDQRDKLVAQHPDHPLYKTAVLEGKVLRAQRDAIAYEYALFHEDMRGMRAGENTFYALNIASSALEAAAAHVAIHGLSNPSYNKSAQILFIVTGAIATISPILSVAAGRLAGKLAYHHVTTMLGAEPHFDYDSLRTSEQQFSQSLADLDQEAVSRAIYRSGAYLQSGRNFRDQLNRETTKINHINKVAVQSAILGPPIGATLLTQGILGTYAIEKYPLRFRKQFDYFYAGTIVGTVGTSTAVVATAASLLAEWQYENKLKKENRLPRQLIEERLKNLDDAEKIVAAM